MAAEYNKVDESSIAQTQEMAAEYNKVDESSIAQTQEATLENKYGGLVPKKKPLIAKDPKRAFFDSADWALQKQDANVDERTIAAIENLKPKLERTPHKQLPPRGRTFFCGQENMTDSNF
ncbi:unnamed protein product [Thlaspi arvense]|uniref:cAMP-regulated phosphoprotein 19-related protein n=1 Tax=Thlaspi arvense TaxID=13288 RepID=A0AAU9T3Z6_THLAR|nr:unnamed protein product [Thlaspi arvense]